MGYLYLFKPNQGQMSGWGGGSVLHRIQRLPTGRQHAPLALVAGAMKFITVYSPCPTADGRKYSLRRRRRRCLKRVGGRSPTG